MSENKNKMAFPFYFVDPNGHLESYGEAGLTKREFFAALILSGSLGAPRSHNLAEEAVEKADALIAELAKVKE